MSPAGRARRLTLLENRVDSLAVTLTAVVAAGGSRSQRLDTASVGTAGAPSLGREDSPVVIVEFTDYECPFCRRHFQATLPLIKRSYVDKGVVRYVVRNLPLPIHPFARLAALTAECAANQGPASFWAAHDYLFGSPGELSAETLRRVPQLVPDRDVMERCIESPKAARRIDHDIAEASRLGVSGTPAFIIGRADSTGQVHGIVIRGAYPFALFQSVIDSARHMHPSVQTSGL